MPRLRRPSAALAYVILLVSISALGAAETVRRARAPQFSQELTDLFFPDARQELHGERPTAPTHAPSQTPAQQPSQAGRSSFAWSNIISDDTLDDEIKSQIAALGLSVQSPSQFKGGGHRAARRDCSVLAVLFAVADQYDADLRWKTDAAPWRDRLARSGRNCKVGNDASFQEAKQCHQDLLRLLRREATSDEHARSAADAGGTWSDWADRVPLMQRLEQAQQQGLGPSIASPAAFKKNLDKLRREAELLAALAQVIQRPHYEYSDDETYLEYARQMEQHAGEVAEAARQKNYEQARSAVGKLEKSCQACHEGYRG